MNPIEDSQKKNTLLSVVTKAGTSAEIISLLENTIFGTKGKVRYKQKQIANGIMSQKNIEFIQIKKKNRVLGTTGVVTRSTSGLKKNIKSLYIRYLSVSNPFRKHEKKRLARTPHKRSRVTNHLKKMIGDEITNHFELPIIESKEKAAFYAFVESENFNSKELCINLGFYPTRRISTLLFSRFFPRKSTSVSKIEPSEEENIKAQLKSFYRAHSFYFEDRLFESGTYFILRKKDKIVAGIRCKPVNWQIVEVPGISGFLMQKVLPYLPLTSRLFDPKNLNFLAFDYAWSSDKEISSIFELMNHACSSFDINMGMLWGDKESEVIVKLQESKKLGFLHKLNGEVTAEVMQRFIKMNEAEKKELLDKPVFVSALDMT